MDLTKQILSQVEWNNLALTKLSNVDQREYERQIILVSLRFQLRYKGNLIEKVIKNEKKYYEQLIEYSIKQLIVYPYHLQDMIVCGLSITSFIYYRIIIKNVIISERSYDSIPNFTAADCVRLLGIGRNQFIDLLNTFKSLQAQMGTTKAKAEIENHLPEQPLEIKIEPWHHVRTASIQKAAYDVATDTERSTIDLIIDHQDSGQNFYASNPELVIVLQDLHKKDMIFFNVGVEIDDRFDVPTLDNFVMNRLSGDQFETIMYNVFVSADRRSSVKELAADLQIDVELVRQALSILCRLGFVNRASLDQAAIDGGREEKPKLGFLFDSTLTAYLMMGNLSMSLKKHAVTMFEVGRLTNETLSSFLQELDNLSDAEDGEAQVYHNHAVNLRDSIRFLTNRVGEFGFSGVDLIRCESLLNLEPATRARILNKHYSMLITMAPITYEDRQIFHRDWPVNFGPSSPEQNSPWFRLFVTAAAASNSALPAILLPKGYKLVQLPECLEPYSRFQVTCWGHDPMLLPSYNLLVTINDLLMNNSILVQAHDRLVKETNSCLCLLPLPISQQLLAKLDEEHQLLANLHSSVIPLNLCCGYLTFVPQLDQADVAMLDNSSSSMMADSVDDSNSFSLESICPRYRLLEEAELSQDAAGNLLLFSSMTMGLPLFDHAASAKVLDGLVSTGLLGEPMRKSVGEASLALLERFTQFLQQNRGVKYCLNHLKAKNLLSDPDNKNASDFQPSMGILVNGREITLF